MNEWGIPDWTEPRAYGDTKLWSTKRWRWEFVRRRPDFRADFDAVRNYTVEHYREVYSADWARDQGIDPSKLIGPDDPGFSGVTTTDQLVKYGIELFNPRISEQQMWRLNFQPNLFRTGAILGKGRPFDERISVSIPDGAVGLLIDLDRPIAEQLEDYRDHLQYLQTKRHGKKLQRRQHPRLWLTYLRVLDGREAGASWAEIFETVLKSSKKTNLNPAQEAQDVYKRARALRDNWPD